MKSSKQERHHYTTSDYVYKPVEDEKRRDSAKRNLVAEKGITLVVVPCWWDGKVDRYYYRITYYPFTYPSSISLSLSLSLSLSQFGSIYQKNSARCIEG